MPPNLRVVEVSACEKASKRRSLSSASMPTPVSDTSNRTTTPSGPESSSWARSTTSPSSVNFTAFDVRFSSTWRSRDGSPRSPIGSSGEQ